MDNKATEAWVSTSSSSSAVIISSSKLRCFTKCLDEDVEAGDEVEERTLGVAAVDMDRLMAGEACCCCCCC